MRFFAALALLATFARADDGAPALAELAARAAKEGKKWVHRQPQAGELAYDYARAGRRMPPKTTADGYERECIVTFDADRAPYDLLLISRRTKKEKGVVYLIDEMTLRVDLDGKLVAAVRASGKGSDVVRSSVAIDDFYARQVHERELAYYLKGVVRDPNAPAQTAIE
ncbi:MAG: hypothetical protein SF051_16170 [Elusimicrobiota bacterium]|nr:hypothetical protein [Elusimicrobiota bacterium]